MPIAVDPDDLTVASDYSVATGNIWFNPATLRIGLDPSFDSNMDADGVKFQAIYSKAKELWDSDDDYAALPFPIELITDDSGELINGWDFEGTDAADKTTRHLVKSAGWAVRNTSGVVTARWIGIQALGDASAVTNPATATKIYLGATGGATESLTGGYISDTLATLPVNEPFMIYRDDNADGTPDFDYSANEAVIVIREYGLTYARGTSTAIGAVGLAPQLYGLVTGDITADLKISASFADANGGAAPYDGMSIEFHQTAQSLSLGANGPYDFGVTINSNGGTLQQVYEYVQARLLDPADIDETAGDVVQYGVLTPEFLEYVGDVLVLNQVSNPDAGGAGVNIAPVLATETGLVQMTDNTGTVRTFPTLGAVVLNFGANAVDDGQATYRLFYNDGDAYAAASDVYGEFGAPLVTDNLGNPITGTVTTAQETFSYAYDVDQNGAGSGGNDREVILVVIGLDTAQYITAEGTLTSTGVPLSAAPSLERNYSNPA